MASDLETRQRIVDAAAELFAEHGYGGTRLRMVAERAGVNRLTVKRLTGGRPQLFAEVMAAKVTSEAADRVAAAAAAPDAAPALSVLLEAAAEIFADPERSWNVLELEALTQAHRDDDVRALESARVRKRWANMKALTEQTRRSGGLDDDVDDDAFVHFALALSVGLAVVDPVVDRKPSQARWNALMGRIGSAVAPEAFLLSGDHEARTPWRLRVDIPDRPGGLALLMRSLSGLHAYVLSAYALGAEDERRTIDVALTVPSGVSEQAILAAAMAAGSNGYVTEGSLDDGLDLPTRVMDGATELVTNPGFAPQAAAMLVEADHFEVSDAVEGEDDAADILRLQWTADQHVVLQRDWAPFARVEKSRASALLRLAAAISSVTGDTEALGWVEPIKGGGTVWIRLAHPGDADAVAAMHERCSEQSRVHRYFTEVGEWRDINLRRITGGHRGRHPGGDERGGRDHRARQRLPQRARGQPRGRVRHDRRGRLPGARGGHPAAAPDDRPGPAPRLHGGGRHRAGRELRHAACARRARAQVDARALAGGHHPAGPPAPRALACLGSGDPRPGSRSQAAPGRRAQDRPNARPAAADRRQARPRHEPGQQGLAPTARPGLPRPAGRPGRLAPGARDRPAPAGRSPPPSPQRSPPAG